jgi:hypothetical protein
MNPHANSSLKRALYIYLPVILLALLAIAVSIFTHWNAMFYFAGILVIALPLIFGLPLVLASKEEFRARAARYPRWTTPSVVPDTPSEKMLFVWWRILGWAALLFSACALCVLISSIFTHR